MDDEKVARADDGCKRTVALQIATLPKLYNRSPAVKLILVVDKQTFRL